MISCNQQNKAIIQFLALQILKGDTVRIVIGDELNGFYSPLGNKIFVGSKFSESTHTTGLELKDVFIHELSHYFYCTLFNHPIPIATMPGEQLDISKGEQKFNDKIFKILFNVDSEDQFIGSLNNYLLKIDNNKLITHQIGQDLGQALSQVFNEHTEAIEAKEPDLKEKTYKWLEQLQDLSTASREYVKQYATILDKQIIVPFEDYPSFASISSWMLLNFDVDAFLYNALSNFYLSKGEENEMGSSSGMFSKTSLFSTYQRTIAKNPEFAMDPGFDFKALQKWVIDCYVPHVSIEKNLTLEQINFLERMSYAMTPFSREGSLEGDIYNNPAVSGTNLVELPAVIQEMQCASYNVAAGDSLNAFSHYFSKHIQPLIDQSISEFCYEHSFEASLGNEGLKMLGCGNELYTCQ